MQTSRTSPPSKILMPALVACFLGFAIIAAVYAAPISVTTTFVNEAPVMGTPSDGGSDGSNPTNVGANVTFTVTSTDPNHDDYYLAVCKTNVINAGTSGPPTCDSGQTWAISTATANGAQATVTYTALTGDAESNDWYAFVCDGHGTPGLCSASSQGSGSNGSPFKVNHAGTFGWLTPTDTSDGTIAPGDTVKFTLLSVDSSDTDVDTLTDYFYMHICDADTTAFNYISDTCTGGTTICDSSAFYPGIQNGSCNANPSLTSVPTAHTNYQFKVFVEDNHNFPATGITLQAYAVIDVPPVLTSYTTSDPVNLVAGSSDTVARAVTFTDDNGDNDPTLLDMVFFEDTAVDDTCTSDENDCYRVDNVNLASLPASGCSTSTRSAPGTGKTATGTDASLTVSCDFTVWFNAFPSSNWEVSATATDQLGDVNFADSNVNSIISSLNAVGVAEAGIAYGTLALGETSAPQTITIQNAGNIITDALIGGTNMTSGGNSIPRAQQHWSPISTWTWGTDDYALVQTGSVGSAVNGCSDRSIAVTSDHNTYTTSQIFWKLKIPDAQVSGAYAGTTTFLATPNDCSGGI